jgi:hypothetical protein
LLHRRPAGTFPVHVLLVAGAFELALNRVAVPMLRPGSGAPPLWYTLLDNAGLFLFYFTATLAAVVLGARVVGVLRAPAGRRDRVAHVALAVIGLLAAAPIIAPLPAEVTLVLDLGWAVAIAILTAAAFGRGRELGVMVGLAIVALPELLHGVASLGASFLWPESTFDGPGLAVAQGGVALLCLAALASPYCFAPRPFARAVTRPLPVIVAMSTAAVGAVLARTHFLGTSRAAALAIGIEPGAGIADPRVALYLLAFATVAWTLVACLTAGTAARRSIGVGLGLIVFGGYGFRWPHHYLLPLLGFALIVEASRHVREEELAAAPLTIDTPPIADATWASYVAAVSAGLRRTLTEVHLLTTRAEGGLTSSVIVGELGGLAVRTRVERIDGSVIGLDVVLGREIDEGRAATWTLAAIGRGGGALTEGPPAQPPVKLGDAAFDARFRARGNAAALATLLDAGARERVAGTLDGWLACWAGEGLRYRIYPGRGAPLDHPLPLSDLAAGRVGTGAERLVAVIELLAELAARAGIAAEAVAEPAALAEAPEASEAS